MTAYRLFNDIYEYEEAFVDFTAMRRNYNGLKVWFNEENHSLKEKLKSGWEPVGVKFEASSSAIGEPATPDISVWNMSCLVLSQKAKDQLGDLLEKHGELFPLNNGYFLFNCLESVAGDAIDSEQTSIKIDSISADAEMNMPDKLGFIDSKISGKEIFKPGFLNNGFLICQDTFKSRVEKAGLGGLLFKTNLAQMFV